jgi:hypothetical protein
MNEETLSEESKGEKIELVLVVNRLSLVLAVSFEFLRTLYLLEERTSRPY